MSSSNPFFFLDPLETSDPLISSIVRAEEERQQRKLILIASESICPKPVREAGANVFSNIYAEGYPPLRMYEEERNKLDDMSRSLALLRRYQDRRFYKGTEYADFIEAIAIKRAQELFATDKHSNHPSPTAPHEIFVNVQPLSGAAANNAVFNAFLKPGDHVMGLALPHGGHLTHGSEFNRSGKTFRIFSYEINPKTGRIDFDSLVKLARECKPKMIIAGASAYPWEMDFVKFREICDEVGAILLADIAHPAGLIVTGYLQSPIGLADVVTTTTHKTLCGPRGAIILTSNHEHAAKIDMGVFPGEQGGPHLNQIASKAVSFLLDNTESFKNMMGLVRENCRVLAEALKNNGMTLAYGGTENHLVLIDLRKIKSPTGYPLTGEMASRILDLCGLTCNKNTIAGDTSAAHPGAIRLGTTWITQRGMRPEHMPKLAEIISRALKGIHTFRYIESSGYAGRGKIDFGLFEELKRDLDLLVASAENEIHFDKRADYPYFQLMQPTTDNYDSRRGVFNVRGYELREHFGDSESEISSMHEGVALVDTPHHGVFHIYGERARAALQEICTADILALTPWTMTRTFMLDAEGNVIDDVELMRLDSQGDADHFIMISRGSRAERVKCWLRALSDCYVITDKNDVFAKVEGPFIVDDLSLEGNGGIISFSLFGEKAATILAKFDPAWKNLHAGTVQRNTEGVIVVPAPFGSESRIVVLISRDRKKVLVDKLLAAGALKCGVGVIASARREAGLPVYLADGVAFKGADYYNAHPEMFAITKCSYVGMSTLPEPKPNQKAVEFKWVEPAAEVKKSVIYEEHLKLKAKMVPFAGWLMPVWYTSTAEEHVACREGAALFDVSHMGVLDFFGENAIRFLDQVTTNYVHWLRDGQGHYSYLLGPDGVPLDDILLYRINKNHFLMVVNAANADKDEAWLRGLNDGKYIIDTKHPGKQLEARVNIRNLKNVDEAGEDARVDIAFQGQKALPVMLRLADTLEFKKSIYRLKRFCFARGTVHGMDVIVSRTGYTGEDIGFEIYIHPDLAVKFWNLILQEGEKDGVRVAGLGARDSLRTEAGLPLYGHELAGHLNVSPIEAGYGFAIRFHKPYFIGREAILHNEVTRTKELVRIAATSKGTRMMAHGDPVCDSRGTVIGNITSSVVVGGIQYALAYIKSASAKEGTTVFCYPIAGAKGEQKPVTELSFGDKSVLPVEFTIVPRFLRRDIAFPIIVNWSVFNR